MKKIVLLLTIILFIGCNNDDKCTAPNRFRGCEVVSKSSFAINARMRLKLTDSLSVVYGKDYITIKVPVFEADKYHCGDVIR